MKRVTGIGGIFFKAKDAPAPAGLVQASSRHRCPGVGRCCVRLGRLGWQAHGGTTAWLIGPEESEQFAPSKKPRSWSTTALKTFTLWSRLKAEGCNVLDKIDDSEYGKFAWVIDPEGNKVELWQPPAGQ